MTKRPLVSIGMPVYNGESCIGEAIASVLAQTYTDVEIVICDNCSTDRTQEVCMQYTAGDGRIRYFRYPDHTDSPTNFFRALNRARGEFFMWACADDIRPPDSVDNLMAVLLKNPHAVMAHGQIVAKAIQSTKLIANQMQLKADGPSERIREFAQRFVHNAMIYGMYKTEVLKRAVFKLKYGRDYHLCLQMCLFGPVEYCAKPMIILSERSLHPTDDAMGSGRPVTLRNVLRGERADRKVWMTLLYGCRYLLRPSEVSLTRRLGCLYVFGSTFVARYRGRLMRDAILLVSFPIGWTLSWGWWIARHSSILLAVGRKLKGKVYNAS
jgi:glycosyltransferase involved in cell wall biosynthesis